VAFAQQQKMHLHQLNCSLLKQNDLHISENKLQYFKDILISNNDLNAIQTPIKKEIESEVAKFYLSNFPQIAFEVTEKCNLECKYCTYGDFYSGHDQRKNNELDIEAGIQVVKYIYDYCRSNYSTSVINEINISFYGGEPLMNFKFIRDITMFAKSIETKSIHFNFSMTTNATLINRYIDFLIQFKFRLLISLDGNHHNNSYRVFKDGTSSFNKVVSNLTSIKNNFPKYFAEYLNFNSVLHNRNSVEEISTFIQEQFGKSPMIAEISSDGLISEKKAELQHLYKNKDVDLKQSEDYYNLLHKENLKEIPDFKEAMYFIFNQTNLVFVNYSDLYFNRKRSIKPSGTCLPFSRKIFVTANGKLLPCENVSHKYSFGTVTKDGVNIDFNNLAKIYSGYLERMENMCKNCFRITNCTQCMFQLNLNDDSITCYGYMDSLDFSTYLSNIITYFEDHPEVFSKIILETSIS